MVVVRFCSRYADSLWLCTHGYKQGGHLPGEGRRPVQVLGEELDEFGEWCDDDDEELVLLEQTVLDSTLLLEADSGERPFRLLDKMKNATEQTRIDPGILVGPRKMGSSTRRHTTRAT